MLSAAAVAASSASRSLMAFTRPLSSITLRLNCSMTACRRRQCKMIARGGVGCLAVGGERKIASVAFTMHLVHGTVYSKGLTFRLYPEKSFLRGRILVHSFERSHDRGRLLMMKAGRRGIQGEVDPLRSAGGDSTPPIANDADIWSSETVLLCMLCGVDRIIMAARYRSWYSTPYFNAFVFLLCQLY